jgi:hypothetical protein
VTFELILPVAINAKERSTPLSDWLLLANIMFFQILTAITMVVQYSFGKLLGLSPAPIIMALWF